MLEKWTEIAKSDLIEGAELDIVAMEDVNVVHLQSREAIIDAPRHPVGAEIKSINVAAALGGDDDLVPANPKLLQAVPQHRLRDGPPVKPTKRDRR